MKPSNVLFDERGQAVLADFGLSLHVVTPVRLRSMLQSASLEAASKVRGTLAYMVPEVREGQPPIRASDVYSVGIVLFEMLTGRRPGGIERPSEVRPNLDGRINWDDIYAEACRPAVRRPTAAALLERIRQPSAEMQPAPRPLGPRPAPPAPSRQRSKAPFAAFGVLVTLALLLIVAVLERQSDSARRVATMTAPAPEPASAIPSETSSSMGQALTHVNSKVATDLGVESATSGADGLTVQELVESPRHVRRRRTDAGLRQRRDHEAGVDPPRHVHDGLE